MKKWTLTLLGLMWACAIQARAAGAPALAATVVDLRGDVRLQDGDAWQAVEMGQILGVGDRVVTGDGATLQMVLADGSSISLGQDSELTLDEAGDGSAGSQTLLTLARGLLDAMVQRLRLGSSFEIRTPYAVAAVKGTDFEVSGSAGESAVTVREGVVRFGGLDGLHRESVQPFERGAWRGGRLWSPRPLNRAERRALLRRWARARWLHAHRRALLRRLRRGQGRAEFLRRMRRRSLARRRRGRHFNRRERRLDGR